MLAPPVEFGAMSQAAPTVAATPWRSRPPYAAGPTPMQRRVEEAQDRLLAPLDPARRSALLATLQELVEHHRRP
ncbi:hypothetical protein [Pseudonocardia abyssalis]|uniref:Uncharacterized protein n=1 Tax=Pseudonocardia abyssalis TaxID=2792008 RepID=A0ABS6UYQ2_9PSEU|nr:hypothetical protein [Pseudonocardia abyssalis]MBW0117206.1 hypothetical protein [Pseudonocardia abyssalis]MBW0137395.1 hypothetical protein [Pseudonocardia abyssalis]